MSRAYNYQMETPRLIIGNDRIDTADHRPIVDPFTGDTIAQMPQADAALIDRAIAEAHAAFEITRKQSAFERSDILRRAADGITRRRAEFADTILREAGKPITLAEAEVDRAVATFTAASEEARHTTIAGIDLDAFATGRGHAGWTARFPLGVIYGITPFNYPLNLVAHKVAPCIATGNTMVLKPAPRTPLSALLLADVLFEAGLPAGALNVIACDNSLAGKPIDDPRVKMVSFTGSAAVGWPIKARAVKQLVTMELGGNGAVIVCEDADLAAAVPMIAAGTFGYAGQSCISVQRVLVHKSVLPAFREQLVTYVRDHVHTGDPRAKQVINGPMIDHAAMMRIASLVDAATAAGAQLLIGGQAACSDDMTHFFASVSDTLASESSAPDDNAAALSALLDGNCYQPTILENVDPSQDISCKEAFGPVMTLAAYDDFAAAVQQVNASDFGLQAGVFTNDLRRAHAAFASLHVGCVLVNQVPTFRVETMPYGGVKDSGFGREGVKYAMDEMTELRGLVVKLS